LILDYEIEITGYALGAVVGIFLGIFLQEKSYNIKRITTFGQPNVITSKDFNSCLGLGIIKILLEKDPTMYLFENCGHAGHQLILSSKRAYQEEYLDDFGKQMSEKSEFSKFVKSKQNVLTFLPHHSLNAYVAKLQKLHKKLSK